MPTDYDAIAGGYQRAKRQPWRTDVEAFSLLGLIGPLAGREVVDLACGEGHYTRMLRERGAARVVGVDNSERMIALARAQEAEHPLGIDYLLRDCRSLGMPREFDLAVAAYLLNYAASRAELAAMVAGIAACLRPGGRFVTVNSNPDLPFERGASYRKYGFEVRCAGVPGEGSPYTWVLDLEHGPVEVENYWLPASAYDEALRAAGFTDIRWHRPLARPDGAADHPPGFWSDLIDAPPIIGISATIPTPAGLPEHRR